jgi:hypothetical protein
VPVNAQVWRAGVYALSTLVTVAFTLLSGKDLNWDALNYHYYAGFSALNDRFALDFIAASFQAYLNPYAHVPFYLMAKSGMPSIAIATVLAIAHSALLWLTYELALVLASPVPRVRDQMIAVSAVTMAAINPVFLQLVGSSFADISTGVLALGAWVAIARSFRGATFHAVAIAGILAGGATALKLSNAVLRDRSGDSDRLLAWRLGASGACSNIVFDRMRIDICRNRCALGTSFVAGGSAIHFFPFFNGMFKSSLFILEPIKHLRFVPESVVEGLWRPVAIAMPDALVHVEVRAPDIRYVLLFPLLVAGCFITLLRSQFGVGKFDGQAASTTGRRAPPWGSLSHLSSSGRCGCGCPATAGISCLWPASLARFSLYGLPGSSSALIGSPLAISLVVVRPGAGSLPWVAAALVADGMGGRHGSGFRFRND